MDRAGPLRVITIAESLEVFVEYPYYRESQYSSEDLFGLFYLDTHTTVSAIHPVGV